MKTSQKNQFTLYLFIILLGATAGSVIWLFLKAVALATGFIWEWLPERVSLSWYPIIIGIAGGLIIGIIRLKYGDYPEDLDTVMGRVKKEKTYPYKNIVVMLIAAFLPLIIGSSIGPEAGLTGIIVALCYWVGDNIKFAGINSKKYSQIGMAATLGVLFHAPLFGIFTVEEQESEESLAVLTKGVKLLLYGLAVAAAVGIYSFLSWLFGAGMTGVPSFPQIEIQWIDYLMIIIYVLAGYILGLFYEATHSLLHELGRIMPPVIREMIAGLCLGIIGMLLPAVLFSGEEQMAELMENYAIYAPLALIGLAFLKVLLTNVCIQFGLKGGHFFPVIFSGVCMGYGISNLCFTESSHMVFAAAVVTATVLGRIMKKPLAVTVLLFICFPVRLFVWIFLAAVLGSNLKHNFHKHRSNK